MARKQSAHEKYLKCRAWGEARGGYYQKYMAEYNASHRDESRQNSREYRKTHTFILMSGGRQVWIEPCIAKLLENIKPQYRTIEMLKPSAIRKARAEEERARAAQGAKEGGNDEL
jgi:hypothetical protein